MGFTDLPTLMVSTNLSITILAVEAVSNHCNDCFDVTAVTKSTNLVDTTTENMEMVVYEVSNNSRHYAPITRVLS